MNLDTKLKDYARLGIAYYAVLDPLNQLQEPDQMDGQQLKVFGLAEGRYHTLEAPFWLTSVDIGLTLWQGDFEASSGMWLRWCDRSGQVFPTGAEKATLAESARQQAESARQQAEEKATRLAQKLRELGIDPEAV